MTNTQEIVAAESGSPPDRPSVKDILSSGAENAEKFRDLLGTPLRISGFENVTTKNGDTIQFQAIDDDEVEHIVWAPSVVEKQIRSLDENGYLPVRLIPTEVQSANGRTYFTLEEPADA